MLLFNKKLTATQAFEQGLVTEVFPDSSFQTEVWTRLRGYASLPRNVSIFINQHTITPMAHVPWNPSVVEENTEIKCDFKTGLLRNR